MRFRERHELLFLTACVSALVMLAGCSDRRNNPVFPDVHPDAWMDPASADFHGTRVLAVGTDFCYECHGEDATGGIRAVACYQCHESENECVSCHGDPDDGTGAPPPDLSGNTTIDNIGVGAHTIHIQGEGSFGGFSCSVCHVVPETQPSPGHQDTPLPAEITFAKGATIGGINATWDRTSRTCSGIVCHGAGNSSPIWTETHDFECWDCHGDSERSVEANNDPRPAPPTSLTGSSDTRTAGVGAHESHVTTGPLRVGIDCDECHVKPSSVEDAGHIDGGPPFVAEITWGSLAAQDTRPSYDNTGEDPTCADVYCHGGAFDEEQQGSLTEPTWTVVDGSQSACGNCHKIPPHDDFGLGCDVCHGSVVAADTTITAEGKSLHINGIVNF